MQARDDVGNVYFMPGYVGDVQNNMRHGRVRKNPNGALLPVVRADRVPAPASQGQYTYENRFFVYEGEWRENVKHGIVDRMTMACPRTRSRSRACRPWQIADARWQRLRGGLRARRDNRAGTAELAERQFILGRVQAGGDGRAGRMDRQERRTPNAMRYRASHSLIVPSAILNIVTLSLDAIVRAPLRRDPARRLYTKAHACCTLHIESAAGTVRRRVLEQSAARARYPRQCIRRQVRWGLDGAHPIGIKSRAAEFAVSLRAAGSCGRVQIRRRVPRAQEERARPARDAQRHRARRHVCRRPAQRPP